ncbi:hypothetical protein VC83_04786 [Pseudogymnoascus destructans]|uniref:PWWP domain-containing protein n=2 Tax=Pseudogymnoascus destructans TaxID=655981 RepID=L8GCA4_PSED2|nr:uncharacterized protein VC83_04786 [Pseudogymnoascus destructans]ELR10489.1 hypothetical protein GMDG_04768 [Pseudogymnoascus destructans 20631-21]OAF57480.1 hypothetical protein VC83_04786 [Pseudogymnoascus destructans]
MSEHATSVEAVSAPVDSSVARPDNATAEGISSGADATTGDSNGVTATETKEELPVAEAAKEDSEAKVLPEDEKPAETATENGTKDIADTVAEIAEATATPSSANKSKARRKSSGVPEHKGRKLNKKESKAKMSNIHAQPGEYYFIKLRGFPKWPGIVASEDMLPDAILKSRPVTTAKPDGTYREDFAEGGKNTLDRTFPVMFLETNQFAWTPNTDLEPLDTSVVGDVPQGKMSKSLYAAYQLAAENHDLDHYKNVLREFEVSRRRDEKAAKEAIDAKKAAKEAKASAKKGKKTKEVVQDEDEDVEMADAGADEAEKEDKPKASKKRKAVDDETSTPKRTDSVKKPKLKLINSAQKANGAETPKSAAKEKKEKAKPKSKKAAAAPATPKEPELSAEEKSKKKEKEVRFLRHKLQKGLLDSIKKPREDEMKQMSEFITKLEGYSDLEVSIIRATKINKVLKGILKIEDIPKEAEFKFRERSTELLAKWNKILESDTPAPASAQANGTSKEQVNGESATAEDGTKTTGLDRADDTLAPEVDMEDADAKDEQEKPEEEGRPQEEEKPEDEEKAAEDKTEVIVAEATPVEATA